MEVDTSIIFKLSYTQHAQTNKQTGEEYFQLLQFVPQWGDNICVFLISLRFAAFSDFRPREINSSDGPRWEEPQKACGRRGKLDPARLPLQTGETLLGRQANGRHPQGVAERSTPTGDRVTAETVVCATRRHGLVKKTLKHFHGLCLKL